MGDQLLGVYGWAWVQVGSSRLGQAMTFRVVFLFPLSLSSEVKFSLIHPKEEKRQGETVSGTNRILWNLCYAANIQYTVATAILKNAHILATLTSVFIS